jgi:hypothetical protein
MYGVTLSNPGFSFLLEPPGCTPRSPGVGACGSNWAGDGERGASAVRWNHHAMRIVYIIVAGLGLFLLVLSRQEIAQIQRYCAVVAQVKTTATRMYSDEKLRHHSYMTSPSMETVLSELDGAAGLGRSWRFVSWIGAALCISGFASLAYSEWLRRKQPAEELHEREPIRVKLGL